MESRIYGVATAPGGVGAGGALLLGENVAERNQIRYLMPSAGAVSAVSASSRPARAQGPSIGSGHAVPEITLQTVNGIRSVPYVRTVNRWTVRTLNAQAVRPCLERRAAGRPVVPSVVALNGRLRAGSGDGP